MLAYRPTCPRCRRPASYCYCAHLTPIASRTRVVFLQHPREHRMPIGTARMTHLGSRQLRAARRRRPRSPPAGPGVGGSAAHGAAVPGARRDRAVGASGRTPVHVGRARRHVAAGQEDAGPESTAAASPARRLHARRSRCLSHPARACRPLSRDDRGRGAGARSIGGRPDAFHAAPRRLRADGRAAAAFQGRAPESVLPRTATAALRPRPAPPGARRGSASIWSPCMPRPTRTRTRHAPRERPSSSSSSPSGSRPVSVTRPCSPPDDLWPRRYRCTSSCRLEPRGRRGPRGGDRALRARFFDPTTGSAAGAASRSISCAPRP